MLNHSIQISHLRSNHHSHSDEIELIYEFNPTSLNLYDDWFYLEPFYNGYAPKEEGFVLIFYFVIEFVLKCVIKYRCSYLREQQYLHVHQAVNNI